MSPAIICGGIVLVVTSGWAYWATFAQLVHAWNSQPDYSHGFLVPLVTAFLLWSARDRCPLLAVQFAWPGLLLILASIAMRVIAGYFYITGIDGWSIPVWIVGVVWMFGGWPIARWCLPAIAFLYFMIPLPYRAERWLSLPLQSSATHLSVWTLQCLGQPALAEGHTIHLGVHRLEVEQACSGLRMLVRTSALAVGYAILQRRTWWEFSLLQATVPLIALAANVVRIVLTGLLYQHASTEAGRRFTHDFAGWTMMFVAAILFSGVLWYTKCLFPERERVEGNDLLLHQLRDATMSQTQRTHIHK